MALDLSNTLVVGISATALFDLGEADKLFREQLAINVEKAVVEYRRYMLERENEPLEAGTGMPLIKALLELNKFQKIEDAKTIAEPPLVEVVVMSRNSPETGVRVFNTIRQTIPIAVYINRIGLI